VFGRSKKKGEKAAKPKKGKKAKPAKKAKGKKPARKAKAPGVPVKKRPTDIYSVLLLLSLGFVALSCIFLAMELSIYDFPSNMTPWK
jgi:hypothetical protein